MFYNKKVLVFYLACWAILYLTFPLFFSLTKNIIPDFQNMFTVLSVNLFLIVLIYILPLYLLFWIIMKRSLAAVQKKIEQFQCDLDCDAVETILENLVCFQRASKVLALCMQAQVNLLVGRMEQASCVLTKAANKVFPKDPLYCCYCEMQTVYAFQTNDFDAAYGWLEKTENFFKQAEQQGKMDRVQTWYEHYQTNLHIYDVCTDNQMDNIAYFQTGIARYLEKETLASSEQISLYTGQYYLGKALAFDKRIEEAKSCFENVAKGPEKLYVVQCAKEKVENNGQSKNVFSTGQD